MVAGTVWVFLVAAGLFFLWLVGHVGSPLLQAIVVRAGHLSLLGAGTVGAGGLLGSWIKGLLGWVVGAAGAASSTLLGTSAVVGLIALGLFVAWVLGMLPERVVRFDPPDWLAWTGLVLPAIAVQIPGPAGQLVSSLITGTGQLLVGLAGKAVGA